MGIMGTIGRVLFSAIFILGGMKLTNLAGPVEFAGTRMALFGIKDANVHFGLVALATVMEVVGGLMLAAGFMPKLAIQILLAFLIPVTVIVHGTQMHDQAELIAVLKNLALAGALLFMLDSYSAKPKRSTD